MQGLGQCLISEITCSSQLPVLKRRLAQKELSIAPGLPARGGTPPRGPPRRVSARPRGGGQTSHTPNLCIGTTSLQLDETRSSHQAVEAARAASVAQQGLSACLANLGFGPSGRPRSVLGLFCRLRRYTAMSPCKITLRKAEPS